MLSKRILKVTVEGETLLHLLLCALNYLTFEWIFNRLLKVAVECEPLLHLVLCALTYLTCEDILDCLLKATVKEKPLIHLLSSDFLVACFDEDFFMLVPEILALFIVILTEYR